MQVHERTPSSEQVDQPAALREALAVFAGVSFLTWLVSRFEALPPLRDNLHLVVGVLFLAAAMRAAERLPGGLPRYGMALGGLFSDEPEEATPGAVGAVVELLRALARAMPSLLRETAFAAAVCALVFPPFALGFYYWNAPRHAFAWLPERDLGSYVLTQILVVGLPEEALFRGYLQGRLADALPGRMRWLGVDLSARVFILQAALFALLHFIIDLQPARLAVFFPALLFSWVAGRRGGIGAAILVHAACNLLSDVLVRGWL
jgi:uncharacterized protein